jgi:Pyridoxamine 5'-phosphate oxidase
VRTIGLLSDHVSDEIPASHRTRSSARPSPPVPTVMPDGYPQTSVVWCDFDGACVRVSTTRGFAKERNMRHDPRVTLLCYDPRSLPDLCPHHAHCWTHHLRPATRTRSGTMKWINTHAGRAR